MTNALASAAFFAAIRSMFPGGKLNQGQVDGINAIMDAWGASGVRDDRQLAYVLATAFHETGCTMAPVRETFATSDASAKQRLTKAWKSGKLKVSKDYWSGGYFGRGFVQLTHEANYRKAGAKLGIDLVANPSLALEPGTAATILCRGMIEGWFTGKKLSDYIATKADYVSARKIVNGTDRAVAIAGYAETFEAALRAARHAHNEAAGEAARQAVQDALEAERNKPAQSAPQPEEPPSDGFSPAPPVVGNRDGTARANGGKIPPIQDLALLAGKGTIIWKNVVIGLIALALVAWAVVATLT